MTNPIDIITHDHRTVARLFKEYEDLGETAYVTKEKKVKEIAEAIRLHSDMEERFFYSRAKEALKGDDRLLVEESIAEHDVVKRLLEELSVTHPEDPQFDARVKVLNENIAHHVMEEEQELLPRAENMMGKDLLESIGEEMRAFKAEHEPEK